MRESVEGTFRSFDGVEIFYRAFPPVGGEGEDTPRAILLFHRGHEHSGRMVGLAGELNLPQHWCFAWDQRGHGRSPGERGYANHVLDYVRDIDAFVRHITARHGIPEERMVVVAHSVAAVLVAMWAKAYAPRISGMVLGTPALQVKLYVPFALPVTRAVVFLRRRLGKSVWCVQSYVKGKLLTHDPAEAAAYDSDPLISKQIASNILVDLFDVSRQVIADGGAIVTPTLLLSARADWVVKNRPQRVLWQRISSPLKRVRVGRDLFHAIFHERDRGPIVDEVRNFIETAFAYPVERSHLREADRSGPSYEEYQWLAAGLPMISLKRLGYVAQRALMKTIGTCSEGIAIGWRCGFDSGEMLDYVYENEAKGSHGIGKVMDRAYLDSVGWVGIRERKRNMERLLREVITERARAHDEGAAPIRIVDLAGGPARYVLDVVRELSESSYQVLIRDWSESGIASGRALADRLGVRGVEYRRGDAFSPESVREIGSCDVGIVSGLYELFPDNDPVRRSLAAIAQQIPPGGSLLYTNQPWHPQLEMIAEVLVNREQRPWVMRRRSQAEMDELVREAGFRKVRQELDNAGIFTVSRAVRV